MRKFMGWLGGIAATVIGGVAIWYFTKPPEPFTFEGMVIDGGGNAPLPKAMVSFEIKDRAQSKGPYHDFTDEHGSYHIDFSGLSKSANVTVKASANGFHESRPVAFASVGNDNRQDFMLTPATAPPPPGPTTSATPHPLVLAHPPVYFKRAEALKVKAP
jgi:hypothetical protein